MGQQIDFKPEFRRKSNDVIERLKLKKDERARIVLMEAPSIAWAHTLRAPKVLNGKPVMVYKDRRNGEQYRDYDMEFIGRPLCLGDYNTIEESGQDPKHCPACRRASETDEVSPPERRFAMNIVRYTLARDGVTAVTPFSCSCTVWSFTEGIFNKLIDIAEEYGGIKGRDLVLGPCVNEGFQKFEIMAGGKSWWETDENHKRTVIETYEANKIDDLDLACGRRVEAKWIENDIEKIASRWRTIHGNSSIDDGTQAAEAASLTEGLTDLLNTTPAQQSGDANTSALGFGDLLGTKNEKAASKPAEADPLDFTKLLNDMPSGSSPLG